jgi:methylmalonyl-CoA/ethylmalonyl-CoA epimerase
MPEMRLDHIALMVEDLDAAVATWRRLLSVLDPAQGARITWGEGEENGERMRWATFVNPGGCAIQLFAPLTEGGFLKRSLAKRGEHVHHVAFLSSDVDATCAELRDAGVPLVQDGQTGPDTMPWLRWNFVHPRDASGVLVEVAQRYRVDGEAWAPVEGDPQ